MASRKLWIGGSIIFLMVVTLVFQFTRKPHFKHVFINETNNSYYDDSIRMSIFAAYSKTGVQNAVIISDYDPQKTSVEAEATKAFKELDLGRANAGRAILYYFSPKNHALKIEVGYALEGAIPDVMIRSLELAAKSFTYSGHYQDFWAELIITLNNEIKDKDYQTNFSDYDFSKFQYLSGGAGLKSEAYSADWDNLRKEFINADEVARSRYRAQEQVQSSLNVYFESLRAGIGSDDLDILTEESRFMRKTLTSSSYQLYRNERMYRKAGIDRIITVDKLTFVFFNKNNPVLPIILRREDGVWRVHEPYSWSLFQRFEDSNDVFVKYNFSGMSKEFNTFLAARFAKPLQELKTPLSLNFLENEKSDFSDFRSTLIKFYWVDRISGELENWELRNLRGDDLRFAMDAYMNLGLFKYFLETYEIIVEQEPDNLQAKRNYEFYKKIITYNEKDWVLKR
jgi:hypothetical protein